MPAGLQESAAVYFNNAAPRGISGALVDLNSNLFEAKKHMEILEREIALASAVDRLQSRIEVLAYFEKCEKTYSELML